MAKYNFNKHRNKKISWSKVATLESDGASVFEISSDSFTIGQPGTYAISYSTASGNSEVETIRLPEGYTISGNTTSGFSTTNCIRIDPELYGEPITARV